jgi:hypothetical protein
MDKNKLGPKSNFIPEVNAGIKDENLKKAAEKRDIRKVENVIGDSISSKREEGIKKKITPYEGMVFTKKSKSPFASKNKIYGQIDLLKTKID